MRRREFVALGAAVLLSNRAIAQDTRQRRSVGILMGWVRGYPLSEQYLTAFLSSFKQLGWQEASNVDVEVCWPTEELQMVPCAERLVKGNHDVIIATATPALEALVARTQSIPTVFVLLSEPLGRGFVKDLARPGGNLTGFSNFDVSMTGKWLQILKEVVPRARRAAFLFNPDTAVADAFVREFYRLAPTLDFEPSTAAVRNTIEVDDALRLLGERGDGGLVVMSDVFTSIHRAAIISSAERHRVPTVYPYGNFAKEGGLIGYGTDRVDQFRRTASYVDRILKGERAGDLPVQAPTKFEFVVNLKAARAIGVEVPISLLLRADEVIE
jgi:putative tryptophan/tyrosine transport system substrate-binding protein